MSSDHPRACEENQVGLGFLWYTIRSSPLTRGKHLGKLRAAIKLTIILALARNTHWPITPS